MQHGLITDFTFSYAWFPAKVYHTLKQLLLSKLSTNHVGQTSKELLIACSDIDKAFKIRSQAQCMKIT